METSFFLSTLVMIAAGVPITLFLAFLSVIFGSVLGLCVALARLSALKSLKQIAWFYVQVIRSAPLLVMLFLIYSGLSQFEWIRASVFWPILKDPFWCALIALSICESAYTSEIIRGGILSVPKGEIEAAKSVGMNSFTLFRRVVAPQAILQALPAYTSTVVQTVKATSLASLVTIMETTGKGSSIAEETFRQVEVFLITALVYLVLNSVLIYFFRMFELRLSVHRRLKARRLKKIPQEAF